MQIHEQSGGLELKHGYRLNTLFYHETVGAPWLKAQGLSKMVSSAVLKPDLSKGISAPTLLLDFGAAGSLRVECTSQEDIDLLSKSIKDRKNPCPESAPTS